MLFRSKHAPFQKCRTMNRYSPWFTPGLTALDQHKHILWCTALASNSPRDMQLFWEVRNQYTQAVRKAKDSVSKQKFAPCSTNSKKFWDTIIEHFNKHFSTAGHAFHLATPTPANILAPPAATWPSPLASPPKSRHLMF